MSIKHEKNISLSLHSVTLEQPMLFMYAYTIFLGQQKLSNILTSDMILCFQVIPNTKHDPYNLRAVEEPRGILAAFATSLEW